MSSWTGESSTGPTVDQGGDHPYGCPQKNFRVEQNSEYMKFLYLGTYVCQIKTSSWGGEFFEVPGSYYEVVSLHGFRSSVFRTVVGDH